MFNIKHIRILYFKKSSLSLRCILIPTIPTLYPFYPSLNLEPPCLSARLSVCHAEWCLSPECLSVSSICDLLSLCVCVYLISGGWRVCFSGFRRCLWIICTTTVSVCLFVLSDVCDMSLSTEVPKKSEVFFFAMVAPITGKMSLLRSLLMKTVIRGAICAHRL